MSIKVIVPVIIFVLIGCTSNNTNNTDTNNTASNVDTVGNYFPVTTFIKGELYNIRTRGLTPLKKITIGTKTDSSFVKMDSLEQEFAPFLTPIIDTANLKTTFVEKKFLDQTFQAFTFTYDVKPNTNNSFGFLHWDVYVDPETNLVNRIYLVKKLTDSTVQQLTWFTGKNCQIFTINNNTSTITEKQHIVWNY